MNTIARTWMCIGALGLALGLAACSDDNGNSTPDSPVVHLPDARVVDAGTAATVDASSAPDANQSADCVQNPTSPGDILNGCTSASVTRIDHNPTLPLIQNGQLPPCEGCQ